MKKTTLRQAALKLAFLVSVLFAPLAMQGQQSLPYSYGFEDNNLSADGWVAQVTSSSSGINTAAAQNGSYGFRFNYSENPGYLMSPIFTGNTSAVTVTFSYKEYSSSYGDEQFQVGYTTDESVTDPSAFTYGAVVTASTSWQDYEETLPAGTKRVAIKYIYTDAFYLFLDDFNFEAATGCTKPGAITLGTIGASTATINWTAGGTETSWNVYLVDFTTPVATVTSPTYTFNGVSSGTTYDVAVEAICGSDVSDQRTGSFTTALCEAADQCEIHIELTDAYGDGGGQIQVVDALTNNVLGTYTNSGASSSYNLNVCSGRELQFVFSSTDSWAYENGYVITDVNNDVIAEHTGCSSSSDCSAPTNGVIATFTPSCAPITCPKPTGLTLGTITTTEAPLTWTAGGSETSWKVYLNGALVTTVNTNSYTFTGLSASTSYTFGVSAVCGVSDESVIATVSGTTVCPASFAIPYTYDCENEAGINCWSLLNGETYTGVWNSTDLGISGSFSRSGDNFYFFYYVDYDDTDPDYQTLISPELTGITNGLHVEFYYRQYTNGVETFQVGYSTTDNNLTSFTWDAEVTASTTYQRYSANYPAGTKYVAIKHTSDDQYYLFIDDFLFEESASCIEPSAVAAASITTTGASISWTAGSTETAWDIFVTDDNTIVPDDVTTPTATSVTSNLYPLTSLTPATTYYVYVRAKCSATSISAWSSPAIFHTECVAENLPYSYDFEDDQFDICWGTINTNTSYCAANIMDPTGSSGNHVLAFYRGSSTGTLAAVLPGFSASYPLNGYQITFDACYANSSGGSMTAGKLGIGIMTDPADFTTFELIEEVDITDGYSTFGTHTVMFNNYTGTGHYIAIQDIHTQNGYVLVDNIEVTELPACIPPTNVSVTGGMSAVVTWVGTESSYDIAYSTSGSANPEDVIIATGYAGNSYDLSSVVNMGDNYVWVRANCGANGYSNWESTSYNASYCTPNITSHDGSGITAVSFGTGTDVVNNGDGSTSLPASAPYYGDYTSMIGAVQAGVASTISITTGTGSFPYTFVIWVDLDNSMTFEDSEVLYVGKAASGNGTLNATITIPPAQALGDYRMRIYGADSYFTSFYNNGTTNWSAAHDPCAAGTYRHAHDYTLRVLAPPACMAPNALAASSVTDATATVSWTENGTATNWVLQYGTDNTFATNTEENVNGTPSFDLSGLTAQTTYYARVKADCGSGSESDWSSTLTFTTLCEAVTITSSNTLTEDFEGYTGVAYNATNGVVPNCWDSYSTGSVAPHIIGTGSYLYVHGGSNALTFYGNGYNYAALPLFTNAISELQISFWMQTESASNGSLVLGYITASDVNYNTFTEIATYANNNGSMVQRNTYLDNVPAEATRLVFRWYYSNQYSCCIDDVVVSLLPTCMPPSSLAVTATTTTTATLSWTKNGTESAWQICLNGDETNLIDAPSADASISVSGTTVTCELSGLTPATNYTVKVRAYCSATDQSPWSNVTNIITQCDVITSVGYAENFDSYTAGNNVLPVCWSDINTTTNSSCQAYPKIYNSGYYSSPNCLYLNSYAYYSGGSTTYDPQPQYAILPEMNDLAGMRVTLQAKGYSANSTFKVGTMSDPADATTFTEITNTANPAMATSYQEYYFDVPTTTTDRYLAIMIEAADETKTTNAVYIDDISINNPPSCEKPTNLEVTASGHDATATWTSDVHNYDIAYAASSTADPSANIAGTATAETYTVNGLAVGDYYFWVRANCGSTNGYSEWQGPVSVHIGYCTPNPTSHDGNGITGVSFGTGSDVVNNGDGSASLPASSPYYGDYTSMIGAVQAGITSTISITTSTSSYPYTFVIWVDLDNDMVFEDSEVLYVGKAASGTGTLNATITIPPTQALGDYRMRIYGADSYFTSFYNNGTPDYTQPHDPCAAGAWRHAHDYTLRVIAPPACLAPSSLSATNITANSAELSWTANNSEAEWTVYYKKTSDASYTTVPNVTANPYPLTGLDAASSYQFYVEANCSSTETSDPSAVSSFTTLCAPIATFPWTEDFESFTANTVPGPCWDNSASTSTTLSNYPERIWGVWKASDNNKMLYMYNYYVQSGTALINSPTFTLPSEGEYVLSFDYSHRANCGAFTVKVSTNGGTTFTELESYTATSTSYSYSDPGTFTKTYISLAAYAGQSIILQFFANANYGSGAIYVDNIKIARYSEDVDVEAGKWYAISTPVHSGGDNMPVTAVTNLISGTYDLYRYDEANGTWENYRAHSSTDFTTLERGRGYIYRRADDATLTFTGVPNSGSISYTLSSSCADNDLTGFNLVGNPYAQSISASNFYELSPEGMWLAHTTGTVNVAQAFLINSTAASYTFSAPSSKGIEATPALAFTLSNDRYEDVTYAMLEEGDGLPKIGHLAADAPELSIPVNGRKYAIAMLGYNCESFDMAFHGTAGTYTISTDNSQLSTVNYLHLLDKVTGSDIDLLQTPKYTFQTSGNDAGRFEVRLSPGTEEVATGNFAFWNGSEWVVEGNGTLQVYDVLGRRILTGQVDSKLSIRSSQFPATGVYILRLGEKSQKIVVK